MYLVVDRFSEDETFFFESIEEMFKYYGKKSIKEIIRDSGWHTTRTVYKIEKYWE